MHDSGIRRGPGPPRIGLCFALVLFAAVAVAPGAEPFIPQNANPLLESWRWTHFAELDGKNSYCMAENTDGLWFGVQDGVLFYDGREWTSYTAKDGLFAGPVTSLHVGRDGVVWAASRYLVSSNLCVFKEGKWKSVLTGGADAPPTGVANIIETTDGAIWAAFINFDLHDLRYQNDNDNQSVVMRFQTNAFTVYGNPAGSLARIVSNAPLVPLPENLAGIAWSHLFLDRDGCVWMVPNRGGILARWNPQAGAMTSPDAWRIFSDAEALSVRCDPMLFQTRDGRFLFAGGEGTTGVRGYDPKTDRWSVVLSNLDRVHSILESPDGTVWLTSHTHLWERRGDSWRGFELEALGLSVGKITLFESSQGDLWFSINNGGLRRLDLSDQRWISYDGLSFQGSDAAGAEWFLHVDGSVIRQQAGTWNRFDVADGLISDPVTVLCAKDGRIWAAGSHDGVAATAYFENGQWHRQLHPDLSWTVDFRGVLECADGSMWFGANDEAVPGKQFKGGIVYCNKTSAGTNSWTRLLPPHVPETVCGIVQSPDGQIFYGGRFFAAHGTNEFFKFSDPPELRTSWIDSVIAAPSGDLWAARGGIGVFRRHDGVWTKFAAGSGLADIMVSTLFCGRDGVVWAGTPRGISRFDGRSWSPNALGAEAIKLERESGSFRESRDGRLWINSTPRKWCFRAKTGEDFTTATLPAFRTIGFKPGRLTPETTLLIAAQEVSQPGNTLISWKGCDPWERTRANALEYSHRLDQGEWSPYAADTQRMLLAVPSGRHVFEVRARNRDFHEDPTPARFEFEVIAPIWRQPWFLVLMTVLLAAIAAQTLRVLRRDRCLRAANCALAVEIGEHKQAEEQLHARKEEFRALVENAPDPILRYDRDCRRLYVNPAMARLCGKQADALVGTHVQAVPTLVPNESEKIVAAVKAVFQSGKTQEGEIRFRAADGQEHDFLNRFVPEWGADGVVVSVLLIACDITDRKRMEQDVARAQQQLLEASRLAGMAEIATSVLHNIGNVLNSINVSANLLMENLRNSKVQFVSRTADLLKQHASTIGEFMSTDPKGLRLPEYLAGLGIQLSREQTQALKEAADLQKNIEQVNKIVAMQQMHAAPTSITTSVDVVELVEDALRLLESALTRDGIRVVKDLHATRKEIVIDRHKAMQILVSLIDNSRCACDATQQGDKQVTIRVADDESRIRISVADNGIGIPPENMIRIFNQDFTLRKDGRSTELHSGSLTAKEMGGALLAHSDGPGKGAVFTLELPANETIGVYRG